MPELIKPHITGQKVGRGRASAVAADLRSLHSLHLAAAAFCAVGDITRFETACANNQNQASLLLS